MAAYKDRLIQAADLLGMTPDDLMGKLDPPARSTAETENRLTVIRRMATHARNGHAVSILALANEFLTLDAHLSAGGTPPEAWREGPDAPAESNDPYCAAHGRRFDPTIGCVDCIADLPTTDADR